MGNHSSHLTEIQGRTEPWFVADVHALVSKNGIPGCPLHRIDVTREWKARIEPFHILCGHVRDGCFVNYSCIVGGQGDE